MYSRLSATDLSRTSSRDCSMTLKDIVDEGDDRWGDVTLGARGDFHTRHSVLYFLYLIIIIIIIFIVPKS